MAEVMPKENTSPSVFAHPEIYGEARFLAVNAGGDMDGPYTTYRAAARATQHQGPGWYVVTLLAVSEEQVVQDHTGAFFVHYNPRKTPREWQGEMDTEVLISENGVHGFPSRDFKKIYGPI